MLKVCRTCLEETPDSNCHHLNNANQKIKEKFRLCLPELDVELVPDAVMCLKCVSELYSSYDFKQKCLLTEKQIREHLHTQAVAISLVEVKRMSSEVSAGGRNGGACGSDDDDDDDTNLNSLILGLCESAPRREPPPPVPTPSVVLTKAKTPVNNLNSPALRQELFSSARKSTTKTPQSIITEKRKRLSFFTCSGCSTSLANIGQYIGHIKHLHTEENVYLNCPMCEYTTLITADFLKHYEKHTDKKVTQRPNNVFKCPHCSFNTNEMKTLNTHIDSHILKCNKCYYIATNRNDYQKHISTHCLPIESDDVVIIEDEEDISCNYCDYIAKGTSEYENHSLSVHRIKYPFVCKECGYTATSKLSLNKHMQFHTGNRMFCCNHCTYNCDLLYNLNKHLASRHNL